METHMSHRLRSRIRSHDGFTLIELLVVVLIIGILAAIAIPQFIGQKDKANSAAATALVRDATVAMETSYLATQLYPADPAAAVTALTLINPSIAYKATTASSAPIPKNEVVIVTSTPTTYSLAATSGNRTYTLAHAANGAVTRTCVGCTGGVW
jgi:type IV pilus assembly protein PilA